MSAARLQTRPFRVAYTSGNQRGARIVYAKMQDEAEDIVAREIAPDAISSAPVPFDAPDTRIPGDVYDVITATHVQNVLTAQHLMAHREAEDVPILRNARPLGIYLAVTAGLGLVALVHLAPMLIDGLEALWRMVGM